MIWHFSPTAHSPLNGWQTSSSEAINKAFTFDIVDMITKPFSEEKIKSAIEKTIARKK